MYGARIEMARADAAWLARNWWAIALRGVAGIIFGILALLMPAITIRALILLFGVYAVVEGIFAVIAAVSGHSGAPRWLLFLEGIVGIAAGIVAFVWPALTALVLLYVIAAWAIVTGVFEIAAAIQLRKEIEGEIWLGLAGLASIFFGLALFARPGAGALAVVWIIGAYAIVFGALLVALGFRVKALKAQFATSRS